MYHSLKRWSWLFLLPTLAAFVTAFLIPFVMGLYLSFCEFRTVSDARFTGLENYIRAFSGDSQFLSALIFTVEFVIVAVISINLFGFLLALPIRLFNNLKRKLWFLGSCNTDELADDRLCYDNLYSWASKQSR